MDPANPPPLSISLSELDLAPDWASQLRDQPSGQVVWEQVEVRGPRRDGRGGPRRDDRPPRRDDRGGPPRPGGPRPSGPRPGGRAPGPRGPGGFRPEPGPRRDGPPRDHHRGEPRPGGRDAQGPRGGRRDEREGGRFNRGDDRPAMAPPARGWLATVLPEPAGVENLTIQIKSTGRAYQVFDLARLFLSKTDRFRVRFEPVRGEKISPLVLCAPDGSLWLTRDEARRHFTRAGLLGHYFREEKIAVDPPKGAFTTVAICGFSGTVLGPPNFHGYQRTIIHLHQERFKNMPLERYKSRIRMERDEEAVRKWTEAQSSQTHYTLLDGGEEAPTFTNAEDAARHLLETREAEIFAEAPSATVPGSLDFNLLSPGLVTVFRDAVDRQRRFPLELVQELCRQFEGQGLRFFKENKRETFVSRSRPRPLDPGVSISPRVKNIVDFIRKHPLCTYKEVVVGLIPQGADLLERAAAASAARAVTQAPTAENTAATAPPTEQAATATGEPTTPTEAPSAEVSSAESPAAEAAAQETTPAETPAETPAGEAPTAEAPTAEAPAAEAPEAASASAEASTEPSEADREGIALLQDLRWLIREGYVTEFANGQLRVVERQEKPIILQPPRRLRLLGRAFTLWTQPYRPTRPPRWLRLPARAFTLWIKPLTAVEPSAVEVPAVGTSEVEAPAVGTSEVETSAVETSAVETSAVETSEVESSAVEHAAVQISESSELPSVPPPPVPPTDLPPPTEPAGPASG